jgi:hypothetical protein
MINSPILFSPGSAGAFGRLEEENDRSAGFVAEVVG